MTLDAAALKPDTDVRVQPEMCHSSEAGPRPRLATNCAAHQDSVCQMTWLYIPIRPQHFAVPCDRKSAVPASLGIDFQ